jgi:hypothetical protein
VTGLSNLTVQFGTDAADAGLVIENGSLEFAATISATSFTVPGGSLTASGSLQLGYATTNGGTFTLSGGATLAVGSLTLAIDLGGATTPGLVIEAGSLDEIDASLSGSFTVGGLSFTTTDLTVAYSSTNDGTYTISGDTTLTDGSSTNVPLLDIDLGGTVNDVATAGLVISDGTVTAFGASLSSSFTIGGVTLDATGLTVAYSPANNGTYTISGDTSLSGQGLPTISIDLGYREGGQAVHPDRRRGARVLRRLRHQFLRGGSGDDRHDRPDRRLLVDQ